MQSEWEGYGGKKDCWIVSSGAWGVSIHFSEAAGLERQQELEYVVGRPASMHHLTKDSPNSCHSYDLREVGIRWR